MTRIPVIICCCLFAGMAFESFAGNQAEYRKAETCLDTRGELYYSFYVNRPEDIARLTNVVSIDRVSGNKVVAYANREEFTEFLKSGLYYEVLTPPSLEGPAPAMSDYENVAFPLFDWTKYPTYQGYLNIMDQLQSTYPTRVKIHELGTAIHANRRKLLVAQVTSNVGVRGNKPKFAMHAGIHGDELLPIIMVMRLIDWLNTNYNSDARATRILDSVELWISPMLNPDGTYRGGDDVMSSTRSNNNNVDLNRNYPRLPGLGNNPAFQKETQIYMAYTKKHRFVMQIGWHSGVEGISYSWSCVSRAHADGSWFNHVSRQYATAAQTNSPSGYWTDINNGAGQGYHHLYPATGTEKDALLYFNQCRSNTHEASSSKKLHASNLDRYWGYNRDAILQYVLQVLNGIRGTVTDSITGKGLPAKIWVENHDKTIDSSHVYADTSTQGGQGGYGNYYRPIIAGTYSVTYSCPGCTSKTVTGIRAVNGQATVVNVKLYCGGTDIAGKPQNAKILPVAIVPFHNGVRITSNAAAGIAKAEIFTVNGARVTTLHAEPGAKAIVWNGISAGNQKAGAGCYVAHVTSAEGTSVKPFMLAR